MAQSRIKALLATGSLAALVFFGLSQPAYPVHDTTVFELDGNVADAGTAGDDWQTAVTPGLGGNQIAKSGLKDDPAPATIFTGGGSKDDLDLNGPLSGAGGWKHKNGSVPDKDDITNAYAVAYSIRNAQNKPELVIYAGADRLDNSGDAFIGFWFFQNAIGLAPIQGNAGAFVGQHAVGDTLVLANFTGGGSTVTIEVLKWVGSGGNVNGTLQRVFSSNSARCGSLAGDDVCAITNAAPGGEVPPWSYVAKGKTAADGFPTATFFEMGINVTKILGFTPCFSSFMAETRSSSSVSAVLKDFVLGDLNVCGIDVTKVCSSGQVAADFSSIDYSFGGKITNAGFGSLTNVVLEDTPQSTSPAPSLIGAPAYYKCDATGLPDLTQPLGSASPLDAGAEVCYAWKFNTTLNPSKNTIKVTANASATQTVTDTATADCPKLTFDKGITAKKECTASLVPFSNALAVQVGITGNVCNTGELPLSAVTVTDKDASGAPLPNLVTDGTLGPKGSLTECINFSSSYKPTAPDSGTQTQFSDSIVATGTVPALGGGGTITTAPMQIGATCDLCPTGQCVSRTGTTINSLLKKK